MTTLAPEQPPASPDAPAPVGGVLGEARLVAVATIFLTRVPVRLAGTITAADIARASRYYPLVGAGVGAGIGGLFALGSGFFPPLLAATLAALGGAVLTGAFHEDALGDVADAFGGGMTVARKLEIMKDSRLGTYGVLALVGALLVRVEALAALPVALAVPALVAIHAASRAGIVGMLWLSPRARTEGLGADTVGLTAREPGVALGLAALVAVGSLGLLPGLAVLGVAGLAALAVDRHARAQVGGVTGDVLGASQQAGELAALLLLVAWAAVDPGSLGAGWPGLP